MEQSLERSNPKVWYRALMDYGAGLKKLTANTGCKGAHYTKQSRFENSFRRICGEIIRTLSENGPPEAPCLWDELKNKIKNVEKADYYRALETLEKR
jgi:A/G-specific adenine glycosylase